ncbi:biotin-dependent carboxyltransferase [Coprothermobacteraceae bacterium]|nr:biotin-dependent carboxyltransferase [Coprothermobacteraceae bacterium]
MKSAFLVLEPGLLTTIQDEGRFRFRAYGMPTSGPLDVLAYHAANALVGNRSNAAALEITVAGPTLLAKNEVVVALCGGQTTVKLNGSPMPMWEAVVLQPGDVIEIGQVIKGARSYLAVSGGFDVPLVMGSRSTYLRAHMGGLNGRALLKGDSLTTGDFDESILERSGLRVPEHLVPAYEANPVIRVILGPQDDHFTERGLETFLTSEYTVTSECDRMGCRLDGPKIEHRLQPDIVSDGVIPGSIQVPGHGMPIVMLADAQTTGGYPKIATVITADLWKLGQLIPGNKVRFRAISRDEAISILKEWRTQLDCLAMNLVRKDFEVHFRVKIGNQLFQVSVREA